MSLRTALQTIQVIYKACKMLKQIWALYIINKGKEIIVHIPFKVNHFHATFLQQIYTKQKQHKISMMHHN